MMPQTLNIIKWKLGRFVQAYSEFTFSRHSWINYDKYKASRAPAASHSEGADRPSHRQAMGTRTVDSTQVYISPYDCWNMKVLVFDCVMDLNYSCFRVNLLSKLSL